MPAKSDMQCIIEFVQQGSFMKVSAIDPQTMTEVSVIGPVNATRDQLSKLAMRKLRYMLNKKAKKPSE